MTTKARVKRTIDIVITVPAFLVSLPIQTSIAIAVRKKLGAPVLFRQERPGRNGEPFTMVKFRTMLPIDTKNGLISDADRMTPFGAFLRSTSLDELPTLWNIIRGDMSLVGPRPLLMAYLERYTPTQARRHELRPGLTGLAQVNGRNLLPWDERLALDVLYVDTQSVILDIRILMQTLIRVLQREGISASNSATMTEFTGQPPTADTP